MPTTLAVLFLVLVVVNFIGTQIFKRYADAKLEAMYAEGRYDDAIDFLDSWLLRVVMSTYKQYYLRFGIYEAAENTFAAGRMLDHLLNMKASKDKRADLLARAFNFYVQSHSKKQAKDMLEQMDGVVDPRVIADCKQTYGIVFQGDHSHIKQMEAMLPKANPLVKGKLYYLLSRQYMNLGNKSKAKQYERLMNEMTRRPERPQAAKTDTPED